MAPIPFRAASSLSRRTGASAPSLLILQLDTARLRADGLHLGDITRLVSLLGTAASGATVEIRETTNERELLDQLAALLKDDRRFDVVVAIGHSNETGIQIAGDRFAT